MASRRTELRVGIFVMASIVIGGLTAFVIGQQSNYFERFVEYRVLFNDVEGLREGSGVRLAGLSVGSVTRVSFTRSGQVEIRFKVAEEFASRIRGNPRSIPPLGDTTVPQPSRVRIGSKGMLGDKLLDISVGDARLAEWPVAAALPSEGGSDLFTSAGRVMAEAEGTARNLRSATQPFADQQFSHDLETVAANLARISTEISEGDGTLGRLVRDPEMARETQEMITNLRAASAELTQTAHSARQILDEVREGDGSVHRIIYGDELADATQHIGGAAGEVELALRAIREGDGTMHGLIYENDGEQMIQNLTRASDDVAHILADIRAGRGTIGGLLVDPSIYEDVKRLVGDLQRNDILRALVRYSIRRDEATEDTNVRRASGSSGGSTQATAPAPAPTVAPTPAQSP